MTRKKERDWPSGNFGQGVQKIWGKEKEILMLGTWDLLKRTGPARINCVGEKTGREKAVSLSGGVSSKWIFSPRRISS